ncbi:YHYH domain-containing protein [Magnetovibrio blakemorei]|nr:YHYH domain-containing protein [Magnetovibrio blakemorei]
MRYVISMFLSFALFALYTAEVRAHGGGLDSSGCHTNHKTGDYHCHRGH